MENKFTKGYPPPASRTPPRRGLTFLSVNFLSSPPAEGWLKAGVGP